MTNQITPLNIAEFTKCAANTDVCTVVSPPNDVTSWFWFCLFKYALYHYTVERWKSHLNQLKQYSQENFEKTMKKKEENSSQEKCFIMNCQFCIVQV